MKYINYNGNIYSEHEKLLPAINRGTRYGDGFFESMVLFDRKFPLLEYHWNRIEFTMDVLEVFFPKRFDIERFQAMVLDLAAVNNIASNARVRLQFFRKGSGFYLPDENELAYVISLDEIKNTQFEAGVGLCAGFSEEHFKSLSSYSDLKTSSAIGYVLAAKQMKREGWDDIILLNMANQICESLNSNIFLVKGDKLITPDLKSGCVSGVLRSYLLSTQSEIIEERPVSLPELTEADEILLTNAVRGVQWVKSYGSRSYTNKKAVELTAFLNKNLLNIS
jgi:branched-chain amino acid aminotransferase